MKKTITILLTITLLTVLVPAYELKDCYECSQSNSGRNYMCRYAGRLPTTDPYKVACCSPGSFDPECLPSETNICSESYNDMKHNFFTYCPKINATGCGIYNSGGDDKMIIEASNENQTFTYAGMRYKESDYKFKTVDSCYYQVQNPTYYYTSGTFKIVFHEVEPGVKLYLNAGTDVRNSTYELVAYNRTITPYEVYGIPYNENFLITATVEKDSYNTSFSFSYINEDGVPYEWWELYYYQFFKKNPNGEIMQYMAAGMAGLLVILFCCCFCCCIKSCCCRSKSKVDPIMSKELTASGY